MKRTETTIAAASLMWLALVATEPGEGQTPEAVGGRPPDSAAGVAGRSIVFEREVFTYQAGARRNPFLPVKGVPADRPRVEDMRLLGIIHHPESVYSLVVLGIPEAIAGIGDVVSAAPGSRPSWTTARLRSGDVLGRLRIAGIREDHVVIEAGEPDGVAIETLSVPRPAVGRGS